MFATGGAGRIYSSALRLINTGDGVGMALRAGVPVQDMEMWQFTPPASPARVPWSPKGAGAGDYLINKDGERFWSATPSPRTSRPVTWWPAP